MPNLRLRRGAAALAVAALTLTFAVAGPAQASPSGRAGGWLQDQLTHGLVHNNQYDFDDYGLTADTAFALKEIGHHRRALNRIGRSMAEHVDSYTTGVDYGTDDVYAGAVAKAAVLARTVGDNPRSFGGVNLIKRLVHRVATDKPIRGRIQDKGSSDYANVIGQALATRALGHTHVSAYKQVRNFLLEQQCGKGYYRLNFAAADASRQGCRGGDETGSAPDTDVTAFVVISLQALPKAKKRNAKVRDSIHDAVRWLKRDQHRNGSFGGGTSTKASNSNSTGLAGWALGATGNCRPAVKAARWVRKLQVTDQIQGERGAIAYDRVGLAAGESDGITKETRDQWRRATAQAGPALLNSSLKACRHK